MAENQKITIWIEGGVIHDVSLLPKGITLEVIDYDTEDADPERVETLEDGQEAIVSVFKSEMDGTFQIAP